LPGRFCLVGRQAFGTRRLRLPAPQYRDEPSLIAGTEPFGFAVGGHGLFVAGDRDTGAVVLGIVQHHFAANFGGGVAPRHLAAGAPVQGITAAIHFACPAASLFPAIAHGDFRVRGLGLGASGNNIELNLEVNDNRDRRDLKNWFDEVWNDGSLVEDVKADVLRYLAQLYQNNSPEFIYFKTLFHIFEDYLSEAERGGLLNEKTGFFETQVWDMLYDFQKDGVKGAINKILKHNGCIIADSVGLGKTFEALAVIKYFELLNGRVLVLCPKKLRDNWIVYRENDERNPLKEDRFSYTVLSHTDLSRYSGTSGDINLSTHSWGNYDLIVIDESHNFRNNAGGKQNDDGTRRRSRYERLMQDIIQSGVQTKVLLLSATPVNTNLDDYVTKRTIDGVFVKLADEEKQIRKDPVARVTDILKRVFGN